MNSNTLTQAAQNIRLLLLDVDGVLSDGKLYYSASGDEIKTFHTQDGHGLKMLRHSGIKVGIITGRNSPLVERRARELEIDFLVQGREDKYAALQSLLAENAFELSEVAFMGDDWPDLQVMTRVGLALSVANAHPAVIARAHWVAKRAGGEGAVREACDWIMQCQGTYDTALAPYLG